MALWAVTPAHSVADAPLVHTVIESEHLAQVLRAQPAARQEPVCLSYSGRSDPELLVVETLTSTSVRRWIFGSDHQRC